MKVLMIGDVVGRYGRKILYSFLDKYKHNYDFIVVNGENAASGFGITEKIANEFFEKGIDCITSGNHIWDKKEIYDFLDREVRLLRPYNYSEDVAGRGYYVAKKNGKTLAVVNMQGRVFMPHTVDCPFKKSMEVVEEIKKITNNIVFDFHAEASSEKITLARYLAGKISALVGTHTHVQTADEEILDGATAYITDLGMTGSRNGSIGTNHDVVLKKFLTSLPQKFELAQGKEVLSAVEIEIDEESGRAKNIKRINWSENEGFRS